MTLKEIVEAGSRFAINEITGEMVILLYHTEHTVGPTTVFRNKKLDKKAMLNMLFNKDQVDALWSCISMEDVMRRLEAYSNSEHRGDYEIHWQLGYQGK